MNFKIPQKQRAEFDRAAALAIKKETFTPLELSEELGTSEFIASIMVGYMEKAKLVTKGKGNDVRRARLTMEEWQAIDCMIENFIPEPEPKITLPIATEPEPLPEITVTDLIPEEIRLTGKTLFAEDGFITITERGSRVAIPLNDVSYLIYRKCGFFRKGSLSFSVDREPVKKPKKRADTVCFGKKQSEEIHALAVKLAQRLEAELIEY